MSRPFRGGNRRSKPLPEGEFEAIIVDLAEDGRGVARIEGKVCFIHGALPGESVKFRYTRKHRDADEGETTQVLAPSPDRVEPPCPHFGLCGGCSLQHLAPAAQIAHKQQQLVEALRRVGKLEPEEVAPPITGPTLGYRRRARLGAKYVDKRGTALVGFRERSSPFLAALETCAVLDPRVGQKLRAIGECLSELSIRRELPQIEIACADTVPAKQWVREAQDEPASAPASLRSDTVTRVRADTVPAKRLGPSVGVPQRHSHINPTGVREAQGEPASAPASLRSDTVTRVRADDVALVLRVMQPPTEADRARLTRLAQEHGFELYLQSGGPDTVAPMTPPAARLDYSPDGSADRLQFQPTDFIQINAAVSQQAVRQALAWLRPQPGEPVLELFCGLGNFSIPLARSGARVTAVEGDAALVARARANAQALGLEVDFHAADLFLPRADARWLQAPFDAVLLDPPRAGAEAMMPVIGARKPGRILYVSCHPGTLARDAGMLVHGHGYRLVRTGVMDMFPHTTHVESMALFERA